MIEKKYIGIDPIYSVTYNKLRLDPELVNRRLMNEDLKGCRKLLVVFAYNTVIGDCIMASTGLRMLREKYPDIEIHLSISDRSYSSRIFHNNKNIDDLFQSVELQQGVDKLSETLINVGDLNETENYDKIFWLGYLDQFEDSIKEDKKLGKLYYRPYSIQYKLGFELDELDPNLEVYINNDEKEEAKNIHLKYNNSKIFVNTIASDIHGNRNIDFDWIKKFIDFDGMKRYMIINKDNYWNDNINVTIEVMNRCKDLYLVDSALLHACSALKKDIYFLYIPDSTSDRYMPKNIKIQNLIRKTNDDLHTRSFWSQVPGTHVRESIEIRRENNSKYNYKLLEVNPSTIIP